MKKTVKNLFEKIKTLFSPKENKIPDYLKNELIIMDLLYYHDFNKISTNESILLFEKITGNFKTEMKSRNINANKESKLIDEYFENN